MTEAQHGALHPPGISPQAHSRYSWPAKLSWCLTRRAFHHFYHEFAWTYDTVAWLVSAGRWIEWGRAALPRLHGRILELGCGPGHLQLALAAQPGVVGLDASPQMGRLAARRLRRAGYQPRLTRALAQKLPFADAAFDTVVATFPSEYILDPHTQAEIRRVLASGGRLVLIPLARLNPGPLAQLVALAYRLVGLRLSAQAEPTAMPELASLRRSGLPMQPTWLTIGASQVLLLETEPHDASHP